ncbi:MAG: hypothetical protein JNG84_15145 [Archangium sp.]|nr:hypothetical protein [Archangium sp.]
MTRVHPKRTVAAGVALLVAAAVWVLGGVWLASRHHGEPASPEEAAALARRGLDVFVIAGTVASLHVAIAALHWRTSWGRLLTATAGALYLVSAIRSVGEFTQRESSGGAFPMYAVGATVLAVLMMFGAFPANQRRTAHRVEPATHSADSTPAPRARSE